MDRTCLVAAIAMLSWASSPLPSSTVAAEDHPGLHIFAMPADGMDVRRLATLPEHPAVCSPEVSPDGAKVAVDAWRAGESSTDAHMLIVHLADGRVEDLGRGCMPTWSSDGDQIAYCRYGQGVFIRTLGGEKDICIDPKGWAIQWSPDGKLLAYVRDGNLVLYNPATESRREVFPEDDIPYRHILHNPTWSPDSTKICFLGQREDGGTELAYVAAKQLMTTQITILRAASDLHPDIAWRRGGIEVLVVQGSVDGRPGQMLAVPLEGDTPAAPYPGQPADRNNGGMSWSRDGKTLYFMSAK